MHMMFNPSVLFYTASIVAQSKIERGTESKKKKRATKREKINCSSSNEAFEF